MSKGFGLGNSKASKSKVSRVSKVSKPKQYRVRKLINPKGKFCVNCREWKEYSEFTKDSIKLSGYSSWCKECHKQYREDNKEHYKQYKKQYREDNKEQIRQYYKQYYEDNKEQIRQYYEDNKEQIKQYEKQYEKQRRKTDIGFRILKNLRNRIYKAIKGNSKSDKTRRLLGCSISKFKDHLESQFQDGMDWNNYGSWHIDHIIPCSSFDLSNPDEQRRCFHYTNLQPLWAEDNISKGNNIDWQPTDEGE